MWGSWVLTAYVIVLIALVALTVGMFFYRQGKEK
jgi:hypothetical protein